MIAANRICPWCGDGVFPPDEQEDKDRYAVTEFPITRDGDTPTIVHAFCAVEIFEDINAAVLHCWRDTPEGRAWPVCESKYIRTVTHYLWAMGAEYAQRTIAIIRE